MNPRVRNITAARFGTSAKFRVLIAPRESGIVESGMDCANCITGADYLVHLAAGIAKWLLMAAAATAVGIRLVERRQRNRRSE